MERIKAIEQICGLVGQDLRSLADCYNVTIWGSAGNKNKGWAGHTIERFLGLPINSAQTPDFGSWELKVVPLQYRRGVERREELRVKETMAITMINPKNVVAHEFEESHLLSKLQRSVVVARIFEDQCENRSLLHSVALFDLDQPEVYEQVKADYNLVRDTIKTQGFKALTGQMGKLVQPRTKGSGHGTVSRAFYARKKFVAHILGEGDSVPLSVTP